MPPFFFAKMIHLQIVDRGELVLSTAKGIPFGDANSIKEKP